MSRYTLEPHPRNPKWKYFAIDGVDVKPADFIQFQTEAVHALNNLEPLRDLLAKVGEHLARSNYAGGLLSEIDNALLESKA